MRPQPKTAELGELTAVDQQGPGLVFDYQDKASPDLGGIVLLLTARQVVTNSQHRRVWIRALPDHSWDVLQALGLDDLFEFFPRSGGDVN